MEQLKKSIRCNHIGRKITDQFYVDDDVNVPDAKSDMSRVILSDSTVKVDDIKMVESYARITGKVLYQILYVTEEAEPRLASLHGKLPFEEMVYAEEEPEGVLFLRSYNAELSVTMIHSRKLNVKAMVEIELGSEGKKEEELTLDVEEDNLYKKYETKELLKLHAAKKDTYRIKEEMKIPGTKENVGTLLWTEAALRKLDTRLEKDEVLLRGELQVFCVYESLEGKTDWVEQMVPFEGRIDCLGAEDTMYHHIYAELADENIDVRMDEDGEMRIFGVEATLELRVAVYEEEKMEILKDVYSLREVCKPQLEELEFESLVMQNHSKYKMAEQLSLPELKDDILQICHSSGFLQVEHTEIVAEGVMVEGVVNICFLYVKADDTVPFDVWQGMVPFTYVIESNEIAPDMKFDITSSLEQLSVGLLGNNEVEVRAVLAFNVFLRRPVEVANIRDIVLEPLDLEQAAKAPGITGYIVKSGDELWDLAKRYNTTVDGIKEVNELSEESLKPGDKILIFKENMSIL